MPLNYEQGNEQRYVERFNLQRSLMQRYRTLTCRRINIASSLHDKFPNFSENLKKEVECGNCKESMGIP